MLVSLVAFNAIAQAEAGRPRLVVGIVVDQLRTDYVELLQSYFGEHGFKSLLADGMYIRDVDFKAYPLDETSATAMLYTGAYPSQTGVPSASVYYPSAGMQGAAKPPLAEGNGSLITNDSFTPSQLRLSTIADELVIDRGGNSKVWSVAMDPQQAVIMTGHSGTGAVWINNSSGNWATTSYYGSLPGAVTSRNLRTPLSQRIDTMVWRPSAALSRVPWIAEHKRLSPFKHTFSRQDRDVYKKFAASALSNSEVTDVALDLLVNLNLGNNPGETDMLNVAYTLAPYKHTGDSQTRTELTDSYLRLDAQIGRLLQAVDKAVGAGNSVIWLTGTGYFDDAVATEPRYRLPGGEFSTRRARSLLNSYLSARFGSAEYVTTIRDGQIYFSPQALERSGVDSDKVVADARTFIAKMSGVSEALTLNDILTPNPENERLRLALDPRTCGEIILRFIPGWEVVYDEQTPSSTKLTRECATMTPAFIKAPGLKATRIDTTVEAVRLAPTLSGALRIRAPNGARARALPLQIH